MIQYIFSSLFFLSLLLFIYIKLRYPFWNNQPVFHTYDYWRYFYSIPFIVYKYRPIKTKYCDFQQIETISYVDCTDYNKKQLINLLQCYYIQSERILHKITNDELDTIFSGTSEPSYISLFYDKLFQNNNGDTELIINPNASGCVTSRAFNMFYRPTLSESTYITENIYFIDYLCVNRNRDITKLNRMLLQTHEYNQRIQNPNIKISLIKKEINLFEGIIPIVKYKTITYYYDSLKPFTLPQHFILSNIDNTNLHLLTDFLYNQTHTIYDTKPCLFDLCILQNASYYNSLIKKGIIYIYCLRNREQIHGFYFFKNTYTEYDDMEGDSLQLYASIMNTSSRLLFYNGFHNSVYQILKNKNNFKLLTIENIGHNTLLMPYLSKNPVIFNNNTAYYLYNMVYPRSPLLPERCLFLI